MSTLDIILPYFNCSKFIVSQLDSIFLNAIPANIKLNVIIVDDCSTADEYLFLKHLCKDNSSITVHRNEINLGVVGSIEKGLQLSTGEYILLADQDDYWLPNKIILSLNKIQEIEKDRGALVFTDLNIADKDLNVTHDSMFRLFQYSPDRLKNNILIQNMVTGCTIILNKKLKDIAIPFPRDLVIHDHWLAICAAYGGEISYVNTPTILYRQHGRNLIGAKKRNLISKLINIKSVLLKKQRSHIQKSIQTQQLAERLKERGLLENVSFLNETSEALESRTLSDVLNLRRMKIINFNMKRSFIITSFFAIVAFYKTCKRFTNNA